MDGFNYKDTMNNIELSTLRMLKSAYKFTSNNVREIFPSVDMIERITNFIDAHPNNNVLNYNLINKNANEAARNRDLTHLFNEVPAITRDIVILYPSDMCDVKRDDIIDFPNIISANLFPINAISTMESNDMCLYVILVSKGTKILYDGELDVVFIKPNTNVKVKSVENVDWFLRDHQENILTIYSILE